jgi:hypothetical protein
MRSFPFLLLFIRATQLATSTESNDEYFLQHENDEKFKEKMQKFTKWFPEHDKQFPKHSCHNIDYDECAFGVFLVTNIVGKNFNHSNGINACDLSFPKIQIESNLADWILDMMYGFKKKYFAESRIIQKYKTEQEKNKKGPKPFKESRSAKNITENVKEYKIELAKNQEAKAKLDKVPGNFLNTNRVFVEEKTGVDVKCHVMKKKRSQVRKKNKMYKRAKNGFGNQLEALDEVTSSKKLNNRKHTVKDIFAKSPIAFLLIEYVGTYQNFVHCDKQKNEFYIRNKERIRKNNALNFFISRDNVSCYLNDFQISYDSNSLIFTSKKADAYSRLFTSQNNYRLSLALGKTTSLEWIPLVVTYKNYDFAFTNVDSDFDDGVYKAQFKVLNKNTDGYCSLTFNGKGKKSRLPFYLFLDFANSGCTTLRYVYKEFAYEDMEIINIPARELIDKIKEKPSNNFAN